MASGILFFVVSFIVPDKGYLRLLIYIIAYLIVGSDVMINAIKNMFKGHFLDENFLMFLATVGAFVTGEYPEGVIVMLLYKIGEYFQDYATDKSRKSISDLMDIKANFANIEQDGILQEIDPTDVKIDDIIVVKVGEKIPLDGVVKKGSAKIDNSSLTGESRHVTLNVGDEILSGSINVEGFIEVEVTKEYKEGTVARILDLVENATERKAKTEKTVSKFARIYTPCILILALIVATCLPIVSSLTYKESIYRALIFLVISCPCAIAISVPLTYFSGIGRASKSGILVKGSDYLDGLKELTKIVFDKTGTLTSGLSTFVIARSTAVRLTTAPLSRASAFI